jgi:hypothetical protein
LPAAVPGPVLRRALARLALVFCCVVAMVLFRAAAGAGRFGRRNALAWPAARGGFASCFQGSGRDQGFRVSLDGKWFGISGLDYFGGL